MKWFIVICIACFIAGITAAYSFSSLTGIKANHETTIINKTVIDTVFVSDTISVDDVIVKNNKELTKKEKAIGKKIGESIILLCFILSSLIFGIGLATNNQQYCVIGCVGFFVFLFYFLFLIS